MLRQGRVAFAVFHVYLFELHNTRDNYSSRRIITDRLSGIMKMDIYDCGVCVTVVFFKVQSAVIDRNVLVYYVEQGMHERV